MKINPFLLPIILILFISCQQKQVTLKVFQPENNRINYGVEKLKAQLKTSGFDVTENEFSDNNQKIIIGTTGDSAFMKLANEHEISFDTLTAEGFEMKFAGNHLFLAGKDPSGILYGCLTLADLVQEKGSLPANIVLKENPEMVLRGTCIGLQKTEYLPGRDVYEYPYTPENFPWFYDKQHWLEYLDMMVENKFNSLCLWNGHPFASLVKLKDYPFALEVDEKTFEMNEDLFGFLTEEADKRGIYVIQMFYNIIVSKPFAEHYKIETQDRSRAILPVIADYTQKSIAAFIEKYPNVGLMVCLGEAMNTHEDDVEWFTKTIIPGVKDGVKALGRTDEPPIILRGHDTDAKLVMEAALPIYKNLYTTHKYNGESLTTYEPRGSWASIHQDLSALGSVHISNVHILANLEPFRYGSQNFIHKSIRAMHEIQGANGLHLYPQTSYWDWPYTADKTNPRLKQIDRDWVWYKAWGRYAWNSNRDSLDEINYWSREFSDYFNCGKYGENIVKAYDESGEIAPKLLRRFGISDGNRQTLLLGMFMSQLVNPYKWRVYQNFYESNGPEGEILLTYAEKEWNNQPHLGETPPRIIDEVVDHGKKAVEEINKAASHIQKNSEEFERVKNDIVCYDLFANYFAERVKAAMLVLHYKHSNNVHDLESAVPHLENSVQYYRELTHRTAKTYLYANSMQTAQRRIPIDGTDGTNKTWLELLPKYEAELENFKNNVGSLTNNNGKKTMDSPQGMLQPVEVELLPTNTRRYSLDKNQKIYEDAEYKITNVASELKQLNGVALNYSDQQENGTEIRFKNNKAVKVVVGYFNGHSYKILPPPTLETNAHANDRGQADIKIANAMEIPGLYPVNVYTYTYAAGENTLKLGKGIALILGFISAGEEITMYDAGIGLKDNETNIDWLFY